MKHATAYYPGKTTPAPLPEYVNGAECDSPISQITEENKQKGAHRVLGTVCSWMLLIIILRDTRFIKTSWTFSSGLLCSSLICLSIKICLKLSKYFFSYSIFCHWLHSSPNHAKLSSRFRRLWEIRSLFYKCCTKPPFWSWFFQMLNHFYWPLLLTRLAKALW